MYQNEQQENQDDSVGEIYHEELDKKCFFLVDSTPIFLSYDLSNEDIVCETRLDPEPCFLLPNNWADITFCVHSDEGFSQQPKPMDRDSNEGNEQSTSPYPALLPEPAPMAEAFSRWAFFLNDEHGKAAAICLHPRYFVSFRHGSHLKFNLGDTMQIYPENGRRDEKDGISVTVVEIEESLDFLLLNSEKKVVEHGPPIARAEKSEPFTMSGYGNDHGSLSHLSGVIHSVCDTYFEGEGRQLGPFILGTSGSSRGEETPVEAYGDREDS